jgi:ATP-dependent RNA helicase RhlB
MQDQHLTDIKFEQLNLPPPLLQGIAEAGFELCTPIQAQTLPTTLSGHDGAGQAQTGTGKTAAFLIAALYHLLERAAPAGRKINQPRALVIAPTRELAVQIAREAEVLAKFSGMRIALVYGGVDYQGQRQQFAGTVDLLIGTPGRLIDYFKQRLFDLRAAQVLVLDEADRMFDLGFIKDVRYLLRHMPKPEKRLSMLFSATLSWRVSELAYEHMNNPRLIKTRPEQVTAEGVRETLYHVSREEKVPVLIGLIRRLSPERALIFVNTKRAGDKVAAYLVGNGLRAGILSGDVPQQKRQRVLQRFKEGDLAFLVATDVAARGLHIPDVSHVFNYDLPQDCEDYVHRIGRTARLGASGEAVSLACEEYVYSLPEIEAYIGHKIPTAEVTQDLLARLEPPARPEPDPRRPRRPRPAGRRQRRRRVPASG